MKLGELLPAGIVLLYFVIVAGVIYFHRWRRKSRWPFNADDKLLRGPGEELRHRIVKIDEDFLTEAFAGLVVSLLIFASLGTSGSKMLGLSATNTVLLAVTGLVVCFTGSAWRIGRLWQKRQQYYLGWFGERYVGEWLEPAKLQGWRVFHDVPFSSNGAKFNVDHVVVGTGGVLVVETKTRRKGNARPGCKDNQVTFNGRELDWPWGADTHGLEQAERNAQFLAGWIKTELGERVHVTPYLALPGWWLENKPGNNSRLCRVVNPKWLPGILAKESPILTPKQVEQISLRLESRCRDVEE